jgi:hypothetical protein
MLTMREPRRRQSEASSTALLDAAVMRDRCRVYSQNDLRLFCPGCGQVPESRVESASEL